VGSQGWIKLSYGDAYGPAGLLLNYGRCVVRTTLR